MIVKYIIGPILIMLSIVFLFCGGGILIVNVLEYFGAVVNPFFNVYEGIICEAIGCILYYIGLRIII
jgi:hypothetical protein